MESKEQKTENALMRKTKKELIDIILRKDDVEIRLKDTIKIKDEDIDILNTRLVGYEADINGLERVRTENLANIENLEKNLQHSKKITRRWEIAFSVVLIAALIVVVIIA